MLILNNNLSETINRLRFFFILFVVFIHLHVPDNLSMCGSRIFVNAIQYGICKLGTPGFFLISGILFFMGGDLTLKKYVNKLKNRCWTILIPYFLWSFIGILITLGYMKLGVPSSFEANSYKDWFFCFLFGICDYPIWFLRTLMVVCILSYPAYFVLRERYLGRVVIVLLLFCYIFFERNNHYIVSSIWFFVGAYLSINKIDPLALVGKYFRLIFLLWVAFYIAVVYLLIFNKSIYIFQELSIMFGLMSTCYLISKPKEFYIPILLKSNIFFIYGFHVFITIACSKILAKFIVYLNSFTFFAFYIFLFAFTVFICVFCAEIIKRVFPFLYRYLTGNR